jgi:membrane protease YdiL (CAAX protease family)
MSKSTDTLVSTIRRVFVSADESRLRSIWRLGIHSILFILCTVFFTAIALALGVPLMNFFEMPDLMYNQLIVILAITVSTYAARRYIDHRSFSSLGLKWTPNALKHVILGFIIAGLLMAVIFFVSLALGWLEVNAYAWQKQSTIQVLSTLGIWFIFNVFISWGEELLSRGYWFQNLRDGISTHAAVILTSVMFAILHAMNLNATTVAILWLIPAGLFLVYGLLRTKQLWLPLGLHLGWNFFQGPIFGFPISGLETFSLIEHTNTGPTVWTGGMFGPEAGLIVLPVLVIGTLIIYWITKTPDVTETDLS